MRPGAVAALCALVAGATVGIVLFAVRDDGDDKDDVAEVVEDGPTTTVVAELEPQFLQLDGVPFTFEFPGSFAAADALPTGYLAILGVDPINFIDVRLTAEQELSDETIADEIGSALETDTVDVLGQATRQAGGTTIISFEVVDNSGAEPTNSRLNFFRAGGSTWELGCQSNAAGEQLIDDACDRMLETLSISD